MDGVLLQTVEALGDSPFVAGAGAMWQRLQGEKEAVQQDILSDGPLLREPAGGVQERDPSLESDGAINWRRRETLEERLRVLNDAQDRLMDGGYGRCLECGNEIGVKRLVADPAASLCINCQTLAEAVALNAAA